MRALENPDVPQTPVAVAVTRQPRGSIWLAVKVKEALVVRCWLAYEGTARSPRDISHEDSSFIFSAWQVRRGCARWCFSLVSHTRGLGRRVYFLETQ